MNHIPKNNAVKIELQATESLPAWLQMVRDHVDSLKFGTVQITVHDSRVVHVERAEKFRFDKMEHDKK